MNKFTDTFDTYACFGDCIRTEANGYWVVAQIMEDHDSHIDDDEVYSLDQSVTGCSDEQHKELMAARKAYENDEWFYCGIVLHVFRCGVLLEECAASRWKIECNYPNWNNHHLTEIANELLEEALKRGDSIIAELVDSLKPKTDKPRKGKDQ